MLKLSNIMTTDVLTLPPDLTIRDAMGILAAQHVSGAPVAAGRKVLGVVTASDLLAFASSVPGAPTYREDEAEWGEFEAPVDVSAFDEGEEPVAAYWTTLWEDAGADTAVRMATPDTPEWSVLDEHTVEEAMTPAVHALPPETDVLAAADYMRRFGIHRVLVMKGGELLGIVTTADVTKAVADHKLSERRYVFGKPRVREDGSWW